MEADGRQWIYDANLSIARYNCLEIKVVAPPLGLVVFFWLLRVVDSVTTMRAACMKAASSLVLKGQSCQKNARPPPNFATARQQPGTPATCRVVIENPT